MAGCKTLFVSFQKKIDFTLIITGKCRIPQTPEMIS